eukprot:3225976-Pyramimonas_sp.AAC.1
MMVVKGRGRDDVRRDDRLAPGHDQVRSQRARAPAAQRGVRTAAHPPARAGDRASANAIVLGVWGYLVTFPWSHFPGHISGVVRGCRARRLQECFKTSAEPEKECPFPTLQVGLLDTAMAAAQCKFRVLKHVVGPLGPSERERRASEASESRVKLHFGVVSRAISNSRARVREPTHAHYPISVRARPSPTSLYI